MSDVVFDTVVTVQNLGPVRTITLNRPEVRNCLDIPIRVQLAAAIREADSEPSCRSVVLAGAGSVFCAGGDIKTLSNDAKASRSRLELAGDVTRSIWESTTPVVAAVQGGAWGAGMAIACACDLVVAGRSTHFVASFGRFGLVGDTGIFSTLRRRVGPARAREILLLNSDIVAEQALAWGIASIVVEDSLILEEAMAIAQQLAAAGPGANASTIQIMRQTEQDFESVLEAEILAQVQLLGTPSFAEGQKAFVEKRKAQWWNDFTAESEGSK